MPAIRVDNTVVCNPSAAPSPNPPCGAVIIFDCDGPEVAEEFVRHDPYVINNVVKSWQIRPWTTVVGEHAKNPVRPS